MFLQSKQEVMREPAAVALHLLVKALGRHVIQARKVRIEEHFLATQDQDAPSDVFGLLLGDG